MRQRNSRNISVLLTLPLIAVMGVVSMGPAASAASPGPGDPTPGGAKGPLALVQHLIDQVTPGDDAAHALPAAPDGHVDVTAMLSQLEAALPKLHGDQRTQAQQILARPTDGSGDYLGSGVFIHLDPSATKMVQTKHFVIHYVSSGTNGATRAQVNRTASVMEHVWKTEVGHLGFHAPKSDANVSSKQNINKKVDIYLGNLGQYRIYGYCAADNYNAATSSGYCVLDNNFSAAKFGYRTSPLNSLRVTAAHEFFHDIQYSYHANLQGWPWFAEGTAVWMEDRVYNSVNDYLQYVPVSPIRRPLVPFVNTGSYARYGSFVAFKFFTSRFHDPTFVRKLWTRVGSGHTPMAAIKSVLASHKSSLPRAMRDFGVWNTLRAHTYPERLSYKPVGWWHNRTLSKSHPGTGRYSVKIKPLATAPLRLKPSSHLGKSVRVVIRVDGPARRYAPAAQIQIRKRNGSVATRYFTLAANGNGVHRYHFNPHKVSSIVLTLTNAEQGKRRTFRVNAYLK
ncbi:MAG TPA: MXAN_6640 family putative metalloprotease [Marmoricola sp.]